MGGMSKSQSSPVEATAAGELLSTGVSSPGRYDDDDPVLLTLKKSPVRKKNPNAKWDGKVAGMTLGEYRARKWSVDACFGKVQRGGPSYSMRPSLPSSFFKKNNNFQVGDVFRGMRATQPEGPSFSMGVAEMNGYARDLSQGPAEYQIASCMDPVKHPTITKNTGARFGSECLEPRDPGKNPAPGDYDANAVNHSSHIKKAANYTMQGREAWAPRTTAAGPGVGEYPGMMKAMRTGKLSPLTWNMQGKTAPLDPPLGSRQYPSPAPCHYKCPGAGGSTDIYKSQAPNWVFGKESRGLRA